MADRESNAAALDDATYQELANALNAMSLGWLLSRAVGNPGAAVLTFLFGLAKARLSKLRQLAEKEVRKHYGNEQIHYVGQQALGDFSSEDCWKTVHKVGGTLWVQNVYVTKDEGLANAVFWHADNQFKLDKTAILQYRGPTNPGQCTAESLSDDLHGAIRAKK